MNDNELEGKIIQELYRWKDVNTEGGKNMFDFYENVYERLYFEDASSDSAWNTEDNSDYRYKTYNEEEKKWEDDEEKKEEEEMFENQKEVTTEVKDVDDNVGFVRELEYTKGVVNPILKDTYRRIVSIDSRYRDKDDYVVSTDFTVNFSETLRNVVSMKLYAVQIPITWYTISAGYGSNFFTIKPNDENSGLNDYAIKLYENAIELYPNYFEFHLYIADLLLKKNVVSAIDHLKKSKQLINKFEQELEDRDEILNEIEELIKTATNKT